MSRDPVRALQHALYRAAKADPGRRFHALFDKVYRRDVLQRAWVAVRQNNGAPGIDRTTLAQIEEYGVDRLLDELAVELRERRYRPLPARRVFIPKPGRGEQRPLSIPAVRDRIVQAALKIVLEPVFEADMADCSFGFRPRRSAHDALQVLIDEQQRGRRWVVETDIAECFTAIPHEELMHAVQERVCDQSVLKLLRVILRAGVMADLGLRPKAAKTRIVHLQVGGGGFDFLGFHHRLVRSRGDRGRPKVTFLARWPADKAMQHAPEKIREITSRRWLLLRPEAIVERLNAFLRGWAAYFRYGHSAQRLSKIRRYAQWRLAHFVRRRHRRSMAFGWWVLTRSRPADLGLIGLYGIVVAPRAGKPWRERPNAGGERRR